MGSVILPLIILSTGVIVAVALHQLLKFGGSPKPKEDVSVPPETIDNDKYVEIQKQKIDVSFDVWQGVKFGFGLGIGLILATGIFWVLMGSLFIISFKSLLSSTF